MSQPTIGFLLVLAASAIAAYTDLRTRRIPDAIPAALFAAGMLLAVAGGWQNAAMHLGLFAGIFTIGTLLFSFKLIGGGDVKLIAASAAALGWPDSAPFLLYTMLAGGVLGIALAAARGQLRPMLANLKAIALPMFAGVRPHSIAPAAGSMPYGLAIFVGAAAAVAGSTFGSSLRIFV